MKVVIYGLTITSSWGNGHATTYRSLCKALARRGHTVHFIEKDVDWYRDHRDLPHPSFCSVRLYEQWRESAASLLEISKDADVIVVGSYFPDAIEATYALLHAGYGPVLFYDIDTPVTLAQLRTHGRTEYLEASLIPHYQAYLSFSGGPSLRVLEKEFGSPHAVGFYCSVDPEVYRPVTASEKYRCDLSYLGTYAADRQVKLMQYLNRAARLLPGARVYRRWAAISERHALGRQCATHRSCGAAGASRLLLFWPVYAEPYPRRYGDGWLLALCAPV